MRFLICLLVGVLCFAGCAGLIQTAENPDVQCAVIHLAAAEYAGHEQPDKVAAVREALFQVHAALVADNKSDLAKQGSVLQKFAPAIYALLNKVYEDHPDWGEARVLLIRLTGCALSGMGGEK